LSELLKMTEAYKRSQNELFVSQSENKLNQQSLAPLQKENERLTKENNQLHLDIIQANEHSEEVDLKWKAANRQLQNESRDLRFLVESKDAKIRALDREIAKMRGKLEKTLAKMYMPSQDEVVEGLAGDILERGELNVMAKAGGHQQEFELNHPVNNNPNDMSDGGLIAAGMDDKL
jgi:chromosome segregation ATPase